MGRLVMPPLEPLATHATEAVAPASGKTLALWPSTDRRRLPQAVSSVDHLELGPLEGDLAAPYDTVVSVGQLGTTPDLSSMLEQLSELLAGQSVLLFCEPTIASDLPTLAPPHDITGSLWAGGFTVFECNRFRVRHHRHTYEYCWGRARLRPPGVPSLFAPTNQQAPG